MIRVTLDTNVLVSATFWTGDSFKILDLIDKKKLLCVLSKDILLEYNKVINSEEITEKIENKELILSKVIQRVIIDSEITKPNFKVEMVNEDITDNKILECAKSGKADFIITNDNHLLKLEEFETIKIITPLRFLKLFSELDG